jgi:hypothetical protein
LPYCCREPTTRGGFQRSSEAREGLCRFSKNSGCADPSRDVTRQVEESGLALVDTLDGHAGIAEFVADGYDVVTF